MEKNELLLEKMRNFRQMLIEAERNDSMIERLLADLQPLFRDIELGRVVPPVDYPFQPPFQGDGVRYGFPHPLYSAAAAFQAALEDWRSKPWWPAGQP